MGYLDDDPKPLYTPPTSSKRVYRSPNDKLSEEAKLSQLNNLNHEVEPEDYSNSPHLNY